eukprot:ctg_2412.g450
MQLSGRGVVVSASAGHCAQGQGRHAGRGRGGTRSGGGTQRKSPRVRAHTDAPGTVIDVATGVSPRQPMRHQRPCVCRHASNVPRAAAHPFAAR